MPEATSYQVVRRVRSARPWAAIAVSAALALVLASTAAGQDADPGPGIQLRSGTCEAPGAVVALLSDLPATDDSAPAAVATSVTRIPLALQNLLDDDHVVTVADATATIVGTCATVAGPLVEDDGVAAPLVDASGAIAGVVWLQATGDVSTTVHVFATSPVDADGEAAPSPSASPEPEDGVVPEVDIDPAEDIDVDVTG